MNPEVGRSKLRAGTNPLRDHTHTPMPSFHAHTVKHALKSAGADLVRSTHLTSGITLSEWSGQNTLTDYQCSAEDVLSIYLSGGEHCSQMRNNKEIRRGFQDAICLFPAGGGTSQWKIADRLHFLHIYFDGSSCEPSLAQSLKHPSNRYNFREVFQEPCPVISSAAHSIAQADWSDVSLSLGIDSLVSWILLNAIRSYTSSELEPVDTRGKFSTARADDITDYLQANLSETIRLEELAQLCNLSRYHFLRKFTNTFGNSPHVYLTGLRMARAHTLLVNSRQKITAVALECGYNQHSQFATAFKRHFGYSPSEVRKRN